MARRDIITAVPTGFAEDGGLDLDASRAILRYVAASGNEGAFVLGTTGEFPAIDDAEFAEIVRIAQEELAAHMRVIVHVGQPSAFEAVRRVRLARARGVREFAALTPYYLPATEEEVFRYFAAISDAVGDGELYVYVFPNRSGIPVGAELLRRLSALPNVVGAKVSERPLADLLAYRSVVPEDFVLYTGADRELLQAGEAGAQGVVSGVSAVLPRPFRELVDAAESGDAVRTAAAQAAVDDCVSVIGGDMARMKAAYRILGIADTGCRMALAAPDASAVAEIRRVVDLYR